MKISNKSAALQLSQAVGTLNILTLEGSSETGRFRYYSNQFFRGLQFRKYVSYEGHLLYWKRSRVNKNFKNRGKGSEKLFRSLDNGIWIGSGKFSVLRTEYLSPAVNVLTKCPWISPITRRDTFEVRFTHNDEEI